jgi:phosphoglycerate-specific signal transduction histidine kinase
MIKARTHIPFLHPDDPPETRKVCSTCLQYRPESHLEWLAADIVASAETRRTWLSGNPEKAFEPSCTTKQNGLGIGLAISRSIAEADGGVLRVRDNQPQGPVFSLALPR